MSQPKLPFDRAGGSDQFKRPPKQARTASSRLNTNEELARAFHKLYNGWAKGPPPPVQVEFYPYASLRNTLRVRNGRIIARLSDTLETAPQEVQEALLAVLICKLLRLRPPAGYRRCYREWANRPEIRERVRKLRAVRGRKQLTAPQGRVYDLSHLFQLLNVEYFDGGLEVDHVCWSPRKARTRLGHYDAAHRTIVINRRLDNPLVPEYVVTFILYHEMLHAALGEQCRNGRQYYHHAEFRQAERRFTDYRRAQRFIEEELS